MQQIKIGASVLAQSISHQYFGSGKILEDISIEIQSGEFVSILGPSGCGKSTFLRFIAGLDRPSQGSIQFGPPDVELIRGFVFQEPRLLPWRSVLANVKLPLELKGESKSFAHQKALAAIERVGLSDALDKYPNQLSGGMKMRVSVARALVLEPSLLLLDEPFSALDETIRHSLQDDLRSLWKSLNMTVIFVTHSIAEAAYLSDRAIILSKSPARLVSDKIIDLPEERDSSIRLEQRFLAEVQKIGQAISFRGEL